VVTSQISAFQDGLLKTGTREQSEDVVISKIRGLDSSIVIDPRRFHLTLGVMALEDEHTKEDGVEGRVNENDSKGGVRETVVTKSARACLAIFSAEDTRSRRVHALPQLSLRTGASTISDDSSAIISSVSARGPLHIQSQSHEGATVPTHVGVSSSIGVTLPTPSASTTSPSTSTSFTTSPTQTITTSSSETSPDQSLNEPKTVHSALSLLRSLKPQLDSILGISIPITRLGSSADGTATEVCSNADTDVEHGIVPGCQQGVSAISVEAARIELKRHRKSVLNVTLDKMDIMQQVAPPKPKPKGKQKPMQAGNKVTTPISSSTTLGSAALIPISPTRVVAEADTFVEKGTDVGLAFSKTENVDAFSTSAFATAESSHAREDGSASSLATSRTNARFKPVTSSDGAHDIWAKIMYLSPREEGEEGQKLRQICGTFSS
jgi:hypothetical protein